MNNKTSKKIAIGLSLILLGVGVVVSIGIGETLYGTQHVASFSGRVPEAASGLYYNAAWYVQHPDDLKRDEKKCVIAGRDLEYMCNEVSHADGAIEADRLGKAMAEENKAATSQSSE